MSYIYSRKSSACAARCTIPSRPLQVVPLSPTIVSGIWSNRHRIGTSFFWKAKFFLEVFTVRRLKIQHMHSMTQSRSGKILLSLLVFQEKQVLHIFIIITMHGKSLQIFKIIVHVDSKKKVTTKHSASHLFCLFRSFSLFDFRGFRRRHISHGNHSTDKKSQSLCFDDNIEGLNPTGGGGHHLYKVGVDAGYGLPSSFPGARELTCAVCSK